MPAKLTLALLLLTALSCRTLSHPLQISSSVADTIFNRTRTSFCDDRPALVDMTQPFFPIATLAQVERDVTGSQLVSLIAEADQAEDRYERDQRAQRIVLPDEKQGMVISNAETKNVAGCYVEISPFIENPYRTGESGAFVRVFRGGAAGRSGSVAFWMSVSSDGSVARLVPLPLFID
ncbi:MAG TPA: hypothetical protein VEK79_01145 [Thermoanaerobaculia bacterium]|nr:hypothetical protein [Thermoanaerobaculia bacterium]